MTTARRLSRVAFSAAATALAEGRSEVALGILLDSLQFARDLAATPTLSESESGADLLVPSWLADFGEEGVLDALLRGGAQSLHRCPCDG